ncbi:MAG: transposase [Atopobiaceae bacterium]|nr:transposase [Atopobiaceae bacterium]
MRTPRKQCESQIYHVVSRGTGRQLIFEDDEDRELFTQLLVKHSTAARVEVFAWCLMGNHFHLLLRAPMVRISACMKELCGRYAQHFNMRHGRVGHLFQERFDSEPVGTEAYLVTVVSYIHYNPQKAHIAKQDECPWSSYGEYVGREGCSEVATTEYVLGVFGGVDSFVRYHEAYAKEASCLDVDSLRKTTTSMPDKVAIRIAEDVLDGTSLDELKSLDRKTRDNGICKLLVARLSVRQVERLTGISRGVIQRVSKQKADK